MRNKIGIYLCNSLLICFFCGISISFAQYSISGKVFDGFSNQPIPSAKLYLTVYEYPSSGKQKTIFSERTTADEQGNYRFDLALDITGTNINRNMKLLASAKNYLGTMESERVNVLSIPSEKIFNFGLLPDGKDATVKGTIYDAVSHAPLSNIPVEINAVESEYQAGTYLQKNKETRKLTTNTDGIYETQIPAKYIDRINYTSRWWSNVQSPDYEIATMDVGATDKCCSRETTAVELEKTTNVAVNVINYYLISKKAKGKLEGLLLDKNNKPFAQTKVRVEVATGRGGSSSSTDSGFG